MKLHSLLVPTGASLTTDCVIFQMHAKDFWYHSTLSYVPLSCQHCNVLTTGGAFCMLILTKLNSQFHVSESTACDTLGEDICHHKIKGERVVSTSTLGISALQPCTQEEADHHIMPHYADAHQHGMKMIMLHATDAYSCHCYSQCIGRI